MGRVDQENQPLDQKVGAFSPTSHEPGRGEGLEGRLNPWPMASAFICQDCNETSKKIQKGQGSERFLVGERRFGKRGLSENTEAPSPLPIPMSLFHGLFPNYILS